ncbi:MAG: protein-glutamine glutaminase family protein [Bacteriovoracaceae bacterium]
MKNFFTFLLFIYFTPIYSQDILIPNFNWKLKDISQKSLNKDILFNQMDRTHVLLNDSICSNRAHVWAFDFLKKNQIEVGKIFLFYTSANSRIEGINWWYHTAPILNQKGNVWIMDAGFPERFNKPLSVNEWLQEFTKEKICKQIHADEDSLVDHMFKPYSFPQSTEYGKFNCYYILTPGGYWIPSSIAKNLSGHDINGNPINFSRDEMNLDEVYTACIEATTTPWNSFFAKKRCANYVNN